MAALAVQLRAAPGGPLRLRKDTSNLFRERLPQPARRIDVRAFDQVLDVDSTAGTVDVEGMASYGALAAASATSTANACCGSRDSYPAM